MYSVVSEISDIKYVLNNLCKATILELKKIYGADYKKLTLEELQYSEIINVIKLKNTNEAVGLYGLIPQGKKSAGIFLLTTDNLHTGNMITFLKGVKKQIQEWENHYELIMDTCHKENEMIKKWLILLGFKPSKYQDDDFQIYFKGNIDLYEVE